MRLKQIILLDFCVEEHWPGSACTHLNTLQLDALVTRFERIFDRPNYSDCAGSRSSRVLIQWRLYAANSVHWQWSPHGTNQRSPSAVLGPATRSPCSWGTCGCQPRRGTNTAAPQMLACTATRWVITSQGDLCSQKTRLARARSCAAETSTLCLIYTWHSRRSTGGASSPRWTCRTPTTLFAFGKKTSGRQRLTPCTVTSNNR